MFWFFNHELCRTLALQPGIKPTSSALEGEALTIGPAEKYPNGELVRRKKYISPTSLIALRKDFFPGISGFLANALLFMVDIEWVSQFDESGRGIRHVQISVFFFFFLIILFLWEPAVLLYARWFRGQPTEEQQCLGLARSVFPSIKY